MGKRGFGLLNVVIILSVFLISLGLIIYSFTKDDGILINDELNETIDMVEMTRLGEGVQFRIPSISNEGDILEIPVKNTGNRTIDGFLIRLHDPDTLLSVNNEEILLVGGNGTLEANISAMGNLQQVSVIPGVKDGEEVKYIDLIKIELNFTLEGNVERGTIGYGCGSGDDCDDGNLLTVDLCTNFACSHRATECSDGIDNDNDNYIDMNDGRCKTPRDDSESYIV